MKKKKNQNIMTLCPYEPSVSKTQDVIVIKLCMIRRSLSQTRKKKIKRNEKNPWHIAPECYIYVYIIDVVKTNGITRKIKKNQINFEMITLTPKISFHRQATSEKHIARKVIKLLTLIRFCFVAFKTAILSSFVGLKSNSSSAIVTSAVAQFQSIISSLSANAAYGLCTNNQKVIIQFRKQLTEVNVSWLLIIKPHVGKCFYFLRQNNSNSGLFQS